MDLPSEAGDVLAHPTRARLFALLNELRRPATTDELAGSAGQHVNGVRRQLERLRVAGLVERRQARRGRGRPRDEWFVAPGASPGGQRPRAYADLSTWLARAIPTSRARLREVERTGREIGRELAAPVEEPSASEPESGQERFARILTALGFRPAIELEASGNVRCRLCNCPYRDSVRESPEVVCTLHRGITAGLLEELAPDARMTEFEPHDPDAAGCLVEIAGTDWRN